MALSLRKFGFVLTHVSLRDCTSSSFRGLFIRGLPVYTVSNSTTKATDTRQENNDDSQEKKEKKSKEDQVLSASMTVRSRRPKPPPPSEGRGGQHS